MPRRILEGKVLSAKQDKTVTVLVESRFMHPIYKKYLKKSKKFAAHDEANTVKEGDVFVLSNVRRFLKTKDLLFTQVQKQQRQRKQQKKKSL